MKLILKIIGGLLALIIVAAIAIPMFISAEYLKAQLITQVKNATGRELTIGGKASLAIFPNIAVSVEDVTLGNPAGFNGKYFAHVDKLETGAALKPLLAKELRITGITVEGAILNLEQNASGAKNWEFASKQPAAGQETAPQPEAKKSATAQPLQIGDVVLKKSAVNFAKAGEKPMAVSDIDVTVKGADGSAPLKVDGSARYQGETVKLKVDLEKSKAFLAGKSSPVELALDLPSASVKFKGTAVNKGSISAEGPLDVVIGDLPKLMGWATGKAASGGLPKKIALKTDLYMQNDKAFALKNLNLAADALSTTGALALNLAGAVPDIQGNLSIAELNLDALSKTPAANAKASAEAQSAPAAAAGNNEGWSTAPIDASGLRGVNGNVKLAIGTLKSGNLTVSNIAADVVMSGGVMKLSLSNASLYSGTAKGVVTVDGSSTGVGIATNLDLSGVQVEPLMTALTGGSRLVGKASLGVNVNGRGASQRAIVSSLGGNGNIRINDGAIKGINIAQFLRDAKKAFILGEKTSESTDFTELSASYTIAQGVLSNSDLSMKSPVVRLGGSGTISLPARSINYRAVPTVVSSIKGQGGDDLKEGHGLSIPLIITGPWSAISVTPDLAGMVQEGLKNPAALKENLKGIKDSLGDFNSPKDIGKALFGGQKEAAPAAAPANGAAPVPAPAAAPTKEEKINDAIGGLLKGLGK